MDKKDFSFRNIVLWAAAAVGGAAVLFITSFYIAVNFKPFIVNMDFGAKKTVYGVYGQFGTQPVTERAAEQIEIIFYKNIGFLWGYSRSTASPSSSKHNRKWQLVGFEVGQYVFAAYQTVDEENSGVGMYAVQRLGDASSEKDVYVGYLLANDSNHTITKCPYVGSFVELSIAEAETKFPSLTKDCEQVSFSR